MLEDKAEKTCEEEDVEGALCVELNGYKSPVLLDRRMILLMSKSFIENLKGSNSIETILSRVNSQTEMRFLIILGA